jgi:hypothetical protein
MTSNKLDDVPINDVTSNGYDEQTPLLHSSTHPNNGILSTPTVDTVLIPSLSHYRPTNILRIIFFIEFLTLLIIWFVGKTFSYLFYLKNFCIQ